MLPAMTQPLKALLAQSGDPPHRIAFQGLQGAYSHLASSRYAPDLDVLPCATFEDAFHAVESGEALLAMIPIENALGGRVAGVHDLLPHSTLHIIDEYFQPIQHGLLGLKGAKLSDIKWVHSHPQALAQCRRALQDLGVRTVEHADTAGAAKDIATEGDKTQAALASTLAAEIYGLPVLRERMEDRLGNITRFVVMARQRIEPDPRDAQALTSLVFALKSVPAALYKSLGGFATNAVNFIRLESYIALGEQSEAQFYAEIQGHPSQPAVRQALEELQFFTTRVKILGVYPASPERQF